MTNLFDFENIGEYCSCKNINNNITNEKKCNNKIDYNNNVKDSEYENIDKIYNILDIAIEKLVLSENLYSLIISGQPGVGKTTRVVNKLNTLILNGQVLVQNENYHLVSGTSTARGLYEYLYDHRNNEILVFDDCDSVFLVNDCISILKAALDDSKNRTISWIKSCKKDNEDYIPQFIFSSKIIFITNLTKDKIDKSLITRSNLLNLYMTNKQIIYIANKIKNELLSNLNEEKQNELIELIKKYCDKINYFSLRTFKKLNALIDNNTSVNTIEDIIKYYLS